MSDTASPKTAPPNTRLFDDLRARMLVIAGILLFVMAVHGAIETGALVGDARDLIDGRRSNVSETFDSSIATLCEQDRTSAAMCSASGTPRVAKMQACVSGSTGGDTGFCRSVWAVAFLALDEPLPTTLTAGNWREWIGHQSRRGVSGAASMLGLFAPDGRSVAHQVNLSITPLFLIALAALALVLIGLGRGTSGRWFGVAISAQNRLSLSLVQMFVWTVMIVAAYAVYAGFNVGLVAETAARERVALVSYFPSMPPWTWGLLGVTVGTPLASGVIKGLKPVPGAAPAVVGGEALSRLGVALSPLQRNASPDEASLLDLFFGEDVDDSRRIDITRTQNVLITLVLMLTYTGFLVATMSDLSPPMLAGLIGTPTEAPFGSFPNPGGTFVGLLLLTHTAYLGGKYGLETSPSEGPPASEPTG